MRLNVRCCCQPTKILGTLEVSGEALRRRRFRLAQIQKLSLSALSRLRDELPLDTFSTVEIKLRDFGNGYNDELAVYSDDLPIEFWRDVPGFIEGDWCGKAETF